MLEAIVETVVDGPRKGEGPDIAREDHRRGGSSPISACGSNRAGISHRAGLGTPNYASWRTGASRMEEARGRPRCVLRTF